MKQSSLAVRLLKGFAMFWWDFLVGDTPEIFVAVLAIIGVVALVSVSAHAHSLGAAVLTVLAVLALGTSVWRAKRAAKK